MATVAVALLIMACAVIVSAVIQDWAARGESREGDD